MCAHEQVAARRGARCKRRGSQRSPSPRGRAGGERRQLAEQLGVQRGDKWPISAPSSRTPEAFRAAAQELAKRTFAITEMFYDPRSPMGQPLATWRCCALNTWPERLRTRILNITSFKSKWRFKMWLVAAYLWDCCNPPSRAKKGTRRISRTSKENKDVTNLMNDFGTDYILKRSYFGRVGFLRECYYTRSHQFLSLV